MDTPTRTLPKGLPAQLQWDAYVIDGAGVVEQSQLAAEACIAKTIRSRRGGIGLPLRVGFVSKNGNAGWIDDGGVIDDLGVFDDGFEDVIEVRVGLKIFGDSPAQGSWIGNVHARAAEIRDGLGGNISQLPGKHGCGFVDLKHALTEELRQVYPREAEHQRGDERGDDEHDDGFAVKNSSRFSVRF